MDPNTPHLQGSRFNCGLFPCDIRKAPECPTYLHWPSYRPVREVRCIKVGCHDEKVPTTSILETRVYSLTALHLHRCRVRLDSIER